VARNCREVALFPKVFRFHQSERRGKLTEVFPEVLWVGNALEARDTPGLFQNQIQAVVDLAMEEPPAEIPRRMIYCRIPLVDGSGNQKERYRLAVTTVESLIHSRTRTLVSCSAGLSRSPSVASIALAMALKKSPLEILTSIGSKKKLDVNQILWTEINQVFQ